MGRTNNKPMYAITYSLITPESSSIGDFEDTGFYQEYEELNDDIIDLVIKDMGRLNWGHWSQSPVMPEDLKNGYIWFEGEYSEDYKTGDLILHGYHFKNLTLVQATKIIGGLK